MMCNWISGWPSVNQKSFIAMSSPGGEETGEGERQNELHPLPDYTKPMTDRNS
jgi:hypothetical protein